MFLDLIEWYSQDRSTAMRYKFPESVEFWRIGYKLFKGKFLRFMGGPKSSGHVIDDSKSKGNFLQENAQVNFVIHKNDKHQTCADSEWVGNPDPLDFPGKRFFAMENLLTPLVWNWSHPGRPPSPS